MSEFPELPFWIMDVQSDYARMLDQVNRIVGWQDITPPQAIMLACIGEQQICAGEIIQRGWYIGQNVTYNLKRLEANGYLVKTVPPTDRRSCLVFLTAKGLAIASQLRERMALVTRREVA